MKMHIIHLSERKDRAQILHRELIRQNTTNFKMWEGVLDEENPKRGIAKAHKQIIEWAYNQNLPSVLIGEDDIKFTAKKLLIFF